MKHASLETRIARALAERGLTLALAESCTGGLIGYRVTSVPGSSAWFRGAVVAYDNGVKSRLLGVKESTLRLRGAVSAETAAEMARGARKALGARVGLSVTGIAGPGGGTAEKPVGLVCAAVRGPRGGRVAEGRFRGGRERVRRRAADMALELLLDFIENDG